MGAPWLVVSNTVTFVYKVDLAAAYAQLVAWSIASQGNSQWWVM
jgi:hypothetical protein